MNFLNSPRLRERREGLQKLNELIRHKAKCFIIHYSCESFITSHGKTPRVTSICINNVGTGQTRSYSIHLEAQLQGKDFNNLSDEEYDTLELSMLNAFSSFVKKHPDYKWIHWNMRDSNYGFVAINNRIQILKGTRFNIPDDFKYDFPKILGQIYTHDFESNKPKGKLLNLAARNKIGIGNTLTGEEEGKAFTDKQYLDLHMSTLRKVYIMDVLFNRAETDNLKVKASVSQVYGLSLPGIVSLVKETPLLLLIVSAVSYFVGTALEPYVQSIFGK